MYFPCRRISIGGVAKRSKCSLIDDVAVSHETSSPLHVNTFSKWPTRQLLQKSGLLGYEVIQYARPLKRSPKGASTSR